MTSSDGDQLSFRMDPERPGPPAALRHMLARTVETPFDDADDLFEPWWGGERAFAYVDVDPSSGEGSVRIVDRRGRDRARVLPELTGTGGLIGRLGGHAAVLDGSLVVVDAAGRTDAAGLADRLAGRPGGIVVYLAFDLVALDGVPLLAEPLERRRERLERTVEAGSSVLVVPAIRGEGRALHAAASAQGISAVVGRHRRSPYLSGVRSRLWRLVPADPSAAGDAGAPTAEGTGSVDPAEGPTPPAGTTPILALIQRLPLDLGD